MDHDHFGHDHEFHSDHNHSHGFYVAFLAFIAITGTIGNLMIIGAVTFEKKLRQVNNGWLFFINLAIADLLVTLIIIPILIFDATTDHHYFNPTHSLPKFKNSKF